MTALKKANTENFFRIEYYLPYRSKDPEWTFSFALSLLHVPFYIYVYTFLIIYSIYLSRGIGWLGLRGSLVIYTSTAIPLSYTSRSLVLAEH